MKSKIRKYIASLARSGVHNKEILIDGVAQKIKKNGIKGDYIEFGLYQGKAFVFAHRIIKKYGLRMHMFGFDSFQGLPWSSEGDLRGRFKEGEYSCSIEKFVRIMKKEKISHEDYTLIPGYFNNTCNKETAAKIKLHKAAIVYIDCDLYESTVPVLRFVTPYLQNGTALVFDDWFSFAGDPYAGEIRATREWLEENQNIGLIEFNRSGSGVSFFVQISDDRSVLCDPLSSLDGM